MCIGNLTGVQHWLVQHPTAGDPLWQRNPASVTELDIQLFYARAGLAGHRRAAIDAVDRLQSALILATIEGELDEAPAALILHEPPPEPFLTDELVDGLAALSLVRRQACLFALEVHLEPADAASLIWRATSRLGTLTPLAREILATVGQTRHLRLPYVFWEWATPTIATPLLELTWSAHEAFDCTWPELTQRYARMARVSRSADAADLLALAAH